MAAASAADAGLRHVSDAAPGIRRQRHGRGFGYRDARGRRITRAATLERIRALAVPPAWTDVWICTDPRGHIQATGRDARGRKQYRYHPRWSAVRGDGKFDRIVAFGQALPRLRRRLRTDMAREGFPRDKVMAMVVAMLGETLVRVGNAEYARDNRSFGLTTLRNRHVDFLRGGRARFRFRGKGGQEHDIVLDDARLVRLLRRCQQLPGQALFQYRDDDGELVAVESGEVNDYLHDTTGSDFSAKDFRTWGGTLAAFQRLARTGLPVDADGKPAGERALAAIENQIVGEVAAALGNTPAVCRKAYIDPAVFAGWRDGRVQRAAASCRGERQWEAAALRILSRLTPLLHVAGQTRSPVSRNAAMATCDVCGNDYDKAFTISGPLGAGTYDSFECAIHALAPTCSHCNCRIIGHGVESDGTFYCCAHCAKHSGVKGVDDRA